MLSITGFIKKQWLFGALLIGATTLSGCGSSEDTIAELLQLPSDTAVQVETDNSINQQPQNDTIETADSSTEEADPVVIQPVDDDPEPALINANMSGRVVDAVTGVPLAGATVTLTGTNGQLTSATDETGSYLLTAAAGTALMASVSLDGYQSEQYSNIALIAESNQNLGTIQLVSNDNAGLGTLTGTISNAINGIGVEGLTLNFRPGINTTSGDVIATTTTDINGSYIVNDLPFGNLTCEIIGVGFDTTFANVVVLGNVTQADQNSAVSPNLNTGEIRIVLTWGDTPRDLDSHLTGPQEFSDEPFHVFFADRNTDLVNLDVDDTSSFGPETITIERQVNGIYRYSVRNFSRNGPTGLSASGAQVQIFDSNGLIRDYDVPNGTGDLWTVFELQGGNITTLNSISDYSIDSLFVESEQPKTTSIQRSLPLYK